MKSSLQFSYHFRATMSPRDVYDAQSWCEENFGEHWDILDNKKGTWCSFWSGYGDPTKYDWHFVNERDSLLFMLRWL